LLSRTAPVISKHRQIAASINDTGKLPPVSTTLAVFAINVNDTGGK
jgi:hypothetical protein